MALNSLTSMSAWPCCAYYLCNEPLWVADVLDILDAAVRYQHGCYHLWLVVISNTPTAQVYTPPCSASLV